MARLYCTTRRPDGRRYYTLVDRRWLPLLRKRSWQRLPNGYIVSGGGSSGGLVYLHRIIADAKEDDELVDHKNRRRYDNRSSNLRLCSRQENTWNRPGRGSRSGLKGVRIVRPGRYSAHIQRQFLGTFPSQRAAAYAYDDAARARYGEYAYYNFPARQRRASAADSKQPAMDRASRTAA